MAKKPSADLHAWHLDAEDLCRAARLIESKAGVKDHLSGKRGGEVARTKGKKEDIFCLLVTEEDESARIIRIDALTQPKQDLIPLCSG